MCVRYRYDKARQKRCKTVELTIDEKDWIPGVAIVPEKRVFVRIDCGETELRELVKRSGGYWNPARKAWSLTNLVLLLGSLVIPATSAHLLTEVLGHTPPSKPMQSALEHTSQAGGGHCTRARSSESHRKTTLAT